MNTDDFRYYTVTIKPVSKALKGNFKILKGAIETFLDATHTSDYNIVYEDEDTINVHAHLLVKCPKIHDKRSIVKYIGGYHLHTRIVPKNSDKYAILAIWHKYTHKTSSDADQYFEQYGNVFDLCN